MLPKPTVTIFDTEPTAPCAELMDWQAFGVRCPSGVMVYISDPEFGDRYICQALSREAEGVINALNASVFTLPSLIEEAGLARKFAEEIEDSWRVFDEGARCHFCGQELRSAGPLCDSVCDHDPDCIVPAALAFLSRDKEAAI